MKYTKLGNSDINISRICMGCMGFGEAGNGQHSWTVDEAHSHEIIKKGLEFGVNFFDTAIAYQSGKRYVYVYEAFEVNAVHYLIKGDTPSPKFEKVFLKAAELASKKGKFCGSMSQLEGKLADYDFARSHRSFLVHLPYITMFRRQELMLKTGEVVPIELTYEQPLKEAFAGYISDYSI